jgi:hypothetical protein
MYTYLSIPYRQCSKLHLCRLRLNMHRLHPHLHQLYSLYSILFIVLIQHLVYPDLPSGVLFKLIQYMPNMSDRMCDVYRFPDAMPIVQCKLLHV